MQEKDNDKKLMGCPIGFLFFFERMVHIDFVKINHQNK